MGLGGCTFCMLNHLFYLGRDWWWRWRGGECCSTFSSSPLPVFLLMNIRNFISFLLSAAEEKHPPLPPPATSGGCYLASNCTALCCSDAKHHTYITNDPVIKHAKNAGIFHKHRPARSATALSSDAGLTACSYKCSYKTASVSPLSCRSSSVLAS